MMKGRTTKARDVGEEDGEALANESVQKTWIAQRVPSKIVRPEPIRLATLTPSPTAMQPIATKNETAAQRDLPQMKIPVARVLEEDAAGAVDAAMQPAVMQIVVNPA
jgi:hypothetical protein